MNRPDEDSLVLASIALIELAEARDGYEGDCLRRVAEYLLRVSRVRDMSQQRERSAEPALARLT